MEGSIPDFNDNFFCRSFGILSGNEVSADLISNEMIYDKTKGGKDFFTSNNTRVNSKNTAWVILCEIVLHLNVNYLSTRYK